MIDLSNNNGQVSFPTVHNHHQYRAYLKRSEGTGFADPTFNSLYAEGLRAHMKIGAYHFARPSKNTPREEADFFCRLMPRLVPGKTLRPCLDLEDPNQPPNERIGQWATEWVRMVRDALHYLPIIYGNAYYLAACDFRRIPCGLWLAAYGRNDGKEYPYTVPRPWSKHEVLAHQYASTAHVPGVSGEVDISHVFRPRRIDVTRLSRRYK